MSTIREEFKKCLDRTPVEEIETEEGTYQSGGILPLPVPYIIRSMALILYIDAAERTQQEPNEKIVSCLRNDLTMNSLMQGLQVSQFLGWWLDQEAWFRFPDEDDDDKEGEWSAWYDLSGIVEKWNEWATLENERHGNGGTP